jgi:photosystem II stability/assembly factor-like uncharacterized protein
MNMRLALPAALSLLLCTGCASEPVAPADTGADTTTDVTPADTVKEDVTDTDSVQADVADDTSTDTSDVSTPTSDWTLRSIGDEGVLTDIFALSTTEAYAVGSSRILRYNGIYWASYGDLEGAQLHGVWSSPELTVVVGEGGMIAHRGENELTWTIVEVPTDADLYGVFGRAKNDIWAVGSSTTILHYDGTAWESVNTGSTTVLRSVWARAGSEGNAGVWAVGSNGRLVRYSGDTWVSEQISSSDVTLNDIWGSGEALFAVGTDGTISMRATDQSVWKGQPSNDPNQRDLHAIAGLSHEDLFLVGDSGTIIQYDGNKWNIQPIVGPNRVAANLTGAAYLPHGQEGAWMAVAADGGGLELAPTGWVDMHTKPQVDVSEMDGSDAAGVWIVGSKGLVLTQTETGWTVVDSGTEYDLNDVEATEDGQVWMVGDEGRVLRVSPEGELTSSNVGVPVALNGVALGPDFVYVCGKGGTLMKATKDTAEFSPILSGTPADINACAWGGDGSLWLAGSFGTLIRLPAGDDAVSVTSNVGDNLNAMAPTSDGVIVAGDNGVVLHATADGVNHLKLGEGIVAGGIGLYGISHHEGLTYAVGWKGTILSTDSDILGEELTPTSAVLEAVWHDGTRAVASGRQGVLLEKTETN